MLVMIAVNIQNGYEKNLSERRPKCFFSRDGPSRIPDRHPQLREILFVRNIFSGISFPLLESVEQQWQQLKEPYARMTEYELALSEDGSDLTEVAQKRCRR